MWQELLITDVTRMGGERVCIAGINHKGQSVRPVPRYDHLTTDYLIQPHFVLHPRAVVELYLKPKTNCRAPHLEDYTWDLRDGLNLLRVVDDTTFEKALYLTASPSVEAIFGTPLHRGKNARPDTGTCSIGTIRARRIDGVDYRILKRENKVIYRLSFTDYAGETYADIPITDLAFRRYFQSRLQQGEPVEAFCQALHTQFNAARAVWLRVALGREWEGWCWLQVNGIYTFPDYLDGRNFSDFDTTDID